MSSSPDILLQASLFRVERIQQTTAQGAIHSREVIRHPGAVVIVPLIDDDHVCLIQNHRVAVAQTLIELPAGTLEPGEDPRETARRELAEETGYRADTIEPLSAFYLSPGILDERMHLFLAKGLTPGHAAQEPGEEIDNLLTSYDEALRMVRDGRIQDAKTMVGLMWYCQFRA